MLLQLFTFVAVCAVVATRLPALHAILGVVAALAWLVLLPLTVRLVWHRGWTGLRDRARGGWELASVATSGLAILAADAGWPWPAVALLALAVCLYGLMTGLVVWRACRDASAPVFSQPDVWILMGGVAIATLAGDHIHRAGVEEIRPASFATAVETGWRPLTTVSLVFFWIALAAWVLTSLRFGRAHML